VAHTRLSALQEHLAGGRLAPVYVLVGEETFLRREALTALKQRVFGLGEGEGPPPAAVVVLEGAEATVADVLDEMATQGFFAETKLVIVEHAPAFIKRNDLGSGFVERLRERSSLAVLVLVADSFDARRSFARQVAEVGVIVDCSPLSRRGPTRPLRSWLKQRAAYHGVTLAHGADDALIARAGVALDDLDQELAKLSLYLADRGRRAVVGIADVETLIPRNRTYLFYELTDALIREDRQEAVRLTGELLSQGVVTPVLVGALGAQFRRLWVVKHRLARGDSVGDACRAAGIKQQFLWERTAATAGRRSFDELAEALGLIAEADLTLKGQRSMELRDDIVLEMLVIRLAGTRRSAEVR